MYRAEKKSLQILLSNTQARPGRKVKQEQEEISRNHVPILYLGSVQRNPLIMAPRFCQANIEPMSGLSGLSNKPTTFFNAAL